MQSVQFFDIPSVFTESLCTPHPVRLAERSPSDIFTILKTSGVGAAVSVLLVCGLTEKLPIELTVAAINMRMAMIDIIFFIFSPFYVYMNWNLAQNFVMSGI